MSRNDSILNNLEESYKINLQKSISPREEDILEKDLSNTNEVTLKYIPLNIFRKTIVTEENDDNSFDVYCHDMSTRLWEREIKLSEYNLMKQFIIERNLYDDYIKYLKCYLGKD